ncbi:unnamed protein product [Cyprideis torosa]|uniref:Uncharacterized protein n=1 Tax=Cyprideis torosa TaxID=163714 RepID=A0A7R8W2N7_9CRUS|nr:unnamed protein product [Cyprideis torosa]CAG0878776.1 unnamed protein product [Cyprideis torosa]
MQDLSSFVQRLSYSAHGHALRHSIGYLRRAKVATSITLLVLGVSLALPAIFGLFVLNLRNFDVSSEEANSLTLYLHIDVSDLRGVELAGEIQKRPDILYTNYISRDEALETFNNHFTLANATDTLDENPLPGAIVAVMASNDGDETRIELLSNEMKNLPEIEVVRYDLRWLKRLNAILTLVSRAVILIGTLLVITALLVIGNTIRLEMLRRSDEISISHLIDEEKELATRLIKSNDLGAAKQLIMSQLRFVVHIARGYSGYGLPLADLIQEGNLGLMKAVKRFDPEKGVRLISFAVHWIRAEIHEYVIRNWRIVKVATTKAQRKLFFKLRSSKKRLSWFNPEEVNQVASDLGVKPEVVLEMESRMSGQDTSFDLPVSSQNEENSSSPSDYIFEEGRTPEQLLVEDDQRSNQHEMLFTAMNTLDDRSQDILRRRWLNDENKATLQELATEYGVSPERIRQIEKNAMNKLKQGFSEH